MGLFSKGCTSREGRREKGWKLLSPKDWGEGAHRAGAKTIVAARTFLADYMMMRSGGKSRPRATRMALSRRPRGQ